jgi:beta-glucosidase
VTATPVHGSTANGVKVRTSLANIGKVAGDEVSQIYVNFPDSPGVPQIALRGFQRVHLMPGERREIEFTLSPRDLSSVTPAGERRVVAGHYRISVGGGQPGGVLPTSSVGMTIKTALEVSR